MGVEITCVAVPIAYVSDESAARYEFLMVGSGIIGKIFFSVR